MPAKTRIIGWDYETPLVRPGCPAPYPVCVSFAGGEDTHDVLTSLLDVVDAEGLDARLSPSPGRPDVWRLLVRSTAKTPGVYGALVEHVLARDCILVAHNLAFEVAATVENGELAAGKINPRVGTKLRCTMVREMLIAIAEGTYQYCPRLQGRPTFSLPDAAHRNLGADIAADLRADKQKAKFDRETGEFHIEGEGWRCRYDTLAELPIDVWPDEAVEYALTDAEIARDVYLAQATATIIHGLTVVDKEGNVTDEARQTRAAVALAYTANTGIQTHPEASADYRTSVAETVALVQQLAFEMGFLKVNKCKECDQTGMVGEPDDYTLCLECMADPAYLPPRARTPYGQPTIHRGRMQALISKAYGYLPPMSDKSSRFPHGQVKYDNDTMKAANHEGLFRYADNADALTQASRYVPIVESGFKYPIHPRFWVLVRSGRTSCSSPNYQNPPRAKGFREAHVAPEGMVFAALDYAAVELRTWAQTCLDLFGKSDMATALQNGVDPHTDLGLQIMAAQGQRPPSYEEAIQIRKDPTHPLFDSVEDARQDAKAGNFGFPGGLGATAFVTWLAGQGRYITEAKATLIKEAWMSRWSESEDYFTMLRQLSDDAPEHHVTKDGREVGLFTICQPFSGRVRGGCSYTSAANSLFQGPAADGIKLAMWAIYREMTEPGLKSPLYGVRTWNMVHDEIMFVGPEATAHEWATRAAHIMETEMRKVTPAIPQIVEPELFFRWAKKTPQKRDSSGRLLPCDERRWVSPAPWWRRE